METFHSKVIFKKTFHLVLSGCKTIYVLAMSTSSQVPHFKVCLVGDGGVGKTTWLNKVILGKFEERYIATLGVEVHLIDIQTNKGLICLNVWDCAGQYKFSGLREGYYKNADAFIGMYSTNSRESKPRMNKFLVQGIRNNPDASWIVVVNKRDIYFKVETNEEDIKMSLLNSNGEITPFPHLISKLMGEDTTITHICGRTVFEQDVADVSEIDVSEIDVSETDVNEIDVSLEEKVEALTLKVDNLTNLINDLLNKSL